MAWRHMKDKVTVTRHYNFTEDKLCWKKHEPCFEEVTVLVGPGDSSDCHLLSLQQGS